MTDRSPTSAEDNLVLARPAAEIDAARGRVRAYLDARKDSPSLADSVDAFGPDGPRLLATDARIVLADLERARANVRHLQYRLRGEKHHHANDVRRLTAELDAERARVAEPCAQHEQYAERLRVAVGGSTGQGPEDWLSAAETLLAGPCGCEPFTPCPHTRQADPNEQAAIQLGYCEASVQASADPEDGEQCPNLREPGSVNCHLHRSHGDDA